MFISDITKSKLSNILHSLLVVIKIVSKTLAGGHFTAPLPILHSLLVKS